VPPPDEPARADILRAMLAGKPQDGIDVHKLAKKTKDFSGADLKAVVDLAVEGVLREAMQSGRPEPLRTKELAAAAKQVKPSTREWFATARNHVLYSNQGGAYDDVARYMGL
jgi:SpoVK/Ycf46/Vps4 family AAA+-type ATPase